MNEIMATADIDLDGDAAGGDRADVVRRMATFRRLLVNTLVTGVTSSFLWFALTFWVYLETRSVVATGVIGGMFSIASAVLGPVFGTYVDHHRKHQAMVLSGSIATASFVVAAVVFYAVDADDLLQLTSPWFWILIASTLVGSVAGFMRGIALSTCVTLLVPDDRRGQGQRPGGHGHRRVVRHHLGVQRPDHRRARHGLGHHRLGGPHRRRPASTC